MLDRRGGGGVMEAGILTSCMLDISYIILHFIKSSPNSGEFNIVDPVKFCCIQIICYYQRGVVLYKGCQYYMAGSSCL